VAKTSQQRQGVPGRRCLKKTDYKAPVPERSASAFCFLKKEKESRMILFLLGSWEGFFRKAFKWGGIAVLVLGLLAGALWGGRFALGKLERRQSRELANAAMENLGQGRPKEARMALETAVRLDPANARALRLLAGMQQAGGSGAEAIQTMQSLAKTGSMTTRDFHAYFSLALRQGDFPLARRLADAASKGDSPALRHRLLARVAMGAENPAEAERELREAVAADRTGQSRLELAKFLFSRNLDPATRVEVLELLRGVSALPDSNGAEALMLGLASGQLPLMETDGWITALRAHPAATARQRFAADRAEAHLHPKRKSETARRAARRLAPRPLAERAEAMDWALALGEPESATMLVRPAEALQNPKLLAGWIDAHSRMGKWNESLRLLNAENPPPGWLLGLFESRALLEEGDPERSREAVEHALGEVRAKPDDFLRAVVFLAAVGGEVEFEKAFQEVLAKNPENSVAVLRAVLPAMDVRRNAVPVFRAFELVTAEGNASFDPLLQNEMDHCALLLGRSVDLESLAARSAEVPSHFPFRATHALGLLKEGHAHEAMQVLEDCKPDVQVALLPARQKMVVASAFAAVGNRDMARQLAGAIPPGEIWPQEAALFSELLAKPPARPVARIRVERDEHGEIIPLSDPAQEASRRAILEAIQIRDITVDIPPDPTQRAIAEALESAINPAADSPDATRRAIQEALREQAAASEAEEEKATP
jgi:tetratricopeptide (TPR) repeat protein